MNTSSELVLDPKGRVMFYCDDCKAPMTKDDLFDLGLRLPDYGETREEFSEAELIDDVRHLRCIRASRAV